MLKKRTYYQIEYKCMSCNALDKIIIVDYYLKDFKHCIRCRSTKIKIVSKRKVELGKERI